MYEPTNEEHDPDKKFPAELNKTQRRVLGVLSEKAYTTPEYYPLTPKAVITGANQKSNRSPVMTLSEDDAETVLEDLRNLGLVTEVHTAGGRTARYRHQLRRFLDITEPQLAIFTELLLRGKQQLGELRSRAARMVTIENQSHLKEELAGLLERGLIQTSGDLNRRGVEVDHSLYKEREGKQMEGTQTAQKKATTPDVPTIPDIETSDEQMATAEPTRSVSTASSALQHTKELTEEIEQLRQENRDLREQIEKLQTDVQEIAQSVSDLRHSLGGY